MSGSIHSRIPASPRLVPLQQIADPARRHLQARRCYGPSLPPTKLLLLNFEALPQGLLLQEPTSPVQ